MNARETSAFQEALVVSSETNEEQSAGKRTQQIIETVLGFILLAVPGLALVLFCWLGLIIELSYGEPLVFSPLLALPLAFVGSLMILAGVRQWRRWGYLWVFLSIPIIVLMWELVSPLLLSGPYDPLKANPKTLGIVVFVLPTIIGFAIVKLYYKRRTQKPK
jgi:hypothetical protein